MDKQLLEIIDSLYESSINDIFLDKFIRDLSIATNSAAGILYATDTQTGCGQILCSYGVATQESNKQINFCNLHQEFSGLVNQSLEKVHYIEDRIPPAQFRLTSIYNNFLSPLGLEQAAVMFMESHEHLIIGTFLRDKSEGCYESADKRIFNTLLPHMQRVFRVKNSTKEIQLNEKIQWELLEYYPFGVLIFSRENKVIFANHVAEEIFSTNDGLASMQSRFGAFLNSENRRLQQVIKETIHSSLHHPQFTQGDNMLVSRPSGKRHYCLQVMPIQAAFTKKAPYPAAIVFIHDTERQANIPIEHMKNLYGLTTTEARVASKITQGKSLEICAKELGHAVPTSRNLLKKVFAKTGTGRQNELVSLLLGASMAILPEKHMASVFPDE